MPKQTPQKPPVGKSPKKPPVVEESDEDDEEELEFGSDEEDEDFEDDDEELESEEDEEDEKAVVTPTKKAPQKGQKSPAGEKRNGQQGALKANAGATNKKVKTEEGLAVSPAKNKGKKAETEKPLTPMKGKTPTKAVQTPTVGKSTKKPPVVEESDEDDDDLESDEEDEELEDEDEELESEEDDEEEDEEEAATPTKQAPQKGQKSQAGDKRNAQQAALKVNAGATNKKVKTEEGVAVPAAKNKEKKVETIKALMPMKVDKKLQEEMEERMRERNRCSLFVKNLPKTVTDEDLKGLSPDIVSVNRKNKWARIGWLGFASEESCKKNYEKLKNAKINGKEFEVDFCTDKVGSAAKSSEYEVDGMKLFVGNLPSSTGEDDLKRLFPSAKQIVKREHKRFAFVHFDSPQAARQAFDKNKNASVNGMKVDVSFAKIFTPRVNKDAVKKFVKKEVNGN